MSSNPNWVSPRVLAFREAAGEVKLNARDICRLLGSKPHFKGCINNGTHRSLLQKKIISMQPADYIVAHEIIDGQECWSVLFMNPLREWMTIDCKAAFIQYPLTQLQRTIVSTEQLFAENLINMTYY